MSQNDNIDAVSNRQKSCDTDFAVQSQNEAYKNSAKIIKKFGVRQGGGAARSNNPLNTPLHTTAANHGAEIAGRTKLTNAMLNVAWLVSLVGRTEAVSLSIITFRDARSLWDCQKRRVYRV